MAKIVVMLMMLTLPSFLRCQSSVTSEIGSDTCISFSKPSMSFGKRVFIERDEAQLCTKLSDQNILQDSSAWNRTFSCVENSTLLAVCFTNTQVSDSGEFYLVHGNNSFREYYTLIVEYPPKVLAFSNQYPVESSNLNVACLATAGNPPSTLYYWTKSEDNDFQQNNTNLRLYNINRNQSGIYICTAENTYTSGTKGSDSRQLVVDVQYPPVVSTIDDIRAVKRDNVRVQCNVTIGNPSLTSIYWTKSGDSGFRQDGSTLVLNYIGRGNSGTYSCVAENSYSGGGEGRNQQSFLVDVLYGPTLNGQTVKVSEGQQARMSCFVTSNPVSNVSWFRGNDLLYTQLSVSGISTYNVPRAQCSDTGQFRVVASNGIQSNYSTTVSLYVYCSPRLSPSGSSANIPVGNNKYLNDYITVLSYPQPNYTLTLPNGAPNTLISLSLSTVSTNIFRITLHKSNMKREDYGMYKIDVSNAYGKTRIYINIIPRSKPLEAAQVYVSCGNRKAVITWQSLYFGYGDQISFVQYSTKPDSAVVINVSDVTTERIEHELLRVKVSHLQDNTKYFFRVVTSNRYGFSLSSVVNCTTETSNGDTSPSPIATGAVLGILLALSIAALAFISVKYFQERKANNKERLGAYDAIENRKSGDTRDYEKCQYRTYENQVFSSESSPENVYTQEPEQKDQVKKERIYENTDAQKAPTSSNGKIKPKIKPKPKTKPES